jgi:hypothetical protein
MATHTVILDAWCASSWITHGFSDTQNRTFYLLTTPSKWKCASSENQTLLNSTSLFWAHSANTILWGLFWTVSLGNTVILYGYKFKSHFNISCTNHLDIPSCAAAFLVDLLGFLYTVTLAASATFSLQHWTIIIKLVLKFMNCFEWRCLSCLKMGTQLPLCAHNTSCFNRKQHWVHVLFYSLPLSAILC